jgi:hypothetical protein
MTTKKLLLALSMVAALPAFAQAPLGTVTNVEGVVTATQGATGVAVTPGTTVQNGMRFVTTTRGSVTLQMNSGCTVSVPPGHGVTVLQSMTCQQLVAAIQPVVPLGAVQTAVGPSPALVNGLIAVGGIAIGIGALQETSRNDETISGQ